MVKIIKEGVMMTILINLFIAMILLILGIVFLVISRITKQNKQLNLQDIAIAFLTAALCVLVLLRDQNNSLIAIVIPEFSLIIGLGLMIKSKRN